MTKECVIFFACLMCGGVYKLALVLAVAIEKRARLKPVTFVLDFVVTGAVLSALALFLLMYNDGIVEPYMIIAVVFGFALISLAFSVVKPKPVRSVKPKLHGKKRKRA